MKALIVTTAVLVGLLAAIVAWGLLADHPLGGEPHVVIAVEAVGEPVGADGMPAADNRRTTLSFGAPRPVDPGAPRAVEITRPPPGFSVVGLDSVPAAARVAPPSPPSSAAIQPEPDGKPLGPVPIEALVQDSRYGPLPRVAADGRRPSEVYARPTPYFSRPRLGEPARIAVVINGLGLSETTTSQGIATLPGQVTLAFSPYGRNLQGWVRQARDAGHEVMLQVPLEPFDYPDNDPGPHTLLTNLPAEENLKRLQWLMARFTGYVGVTNHMGAKFAAAQESFLPMLEELKARGLVYLDDGSAGRSTAGQIARDMGMAYASAHVPIDASQGPEDIDRALAGLERMALEKGLAVGVGTALPITIERVARWAAGLRDKGIVLIPASAAVRVQHQS